MATGDNAQDAVARILSDIKSEAAEHARACEVIAKADEILSDESRWCRGELAMHADDGKECQWCLHGALCRSALPDRKTLRMIGSSTERNPRTLHWTNPMEDNVLAAVGLALQERVNEKYAEYGNNLGEGAEGRWSYWSLQSVRNHLDGGRIGKALYTFNDNESTSFDDIKIVLKRAREICVEWASSEAER